MTHDLIIIGGGQAGLAAAYHAEKQNLRYVVLEQTSDTGTSWRERYDSLKLFTPRRYSQLPGLELSGDPEGYPTKDELADYLKTYRDTFDLNVRYAQSATSVTQANDVFTVTTNDTTYTTSAVIMATGPFQIPRVPDWSTELTIPNFHSADYKNPSQLPSGSLLVVGGGNSGAQIAEELARDHNVTLAVSGKLRFVPARLLGKSLFWWMDTLGILNAHSDTLVAKLLRKRGDPTIGTSLRGLLADGRVTLKPVATNGAGDEITFADGSTSHFTGVVWCTGYSGDYSMLDIKDALDETGRPRQRDGVSETVAGLYFLGLGWMRSRNSALVGGVGRDADSIVSQINK